MEIKACACIGLDFALLMARLVLVSRSAFWRALSVDSDDNHRAPAPRRGSQRRRLVQTQRQFHVGAALSFEDKRAGRKKRYSGSAVPHAAQPHQLNLKLVKQTYKLLVGSTPTLDILINLAV